MIRVLIADDHKLVREGLKRILAAAEDLRVAGEASSGDEALALARANDYDLALVDMSMPGVAGIELIRRLRLEKPALRILVLSMHGEQQYAARALKAGAAGYLTKDSATEQLVGAMRKVAAGGLYITAAAAESLVSETAAGGAAAPHASLSDREFEVFRLLAGGHGPTEIAERLHVSVKTVSTHKARILQKMNLDGTAALVRYALEHDLLDDAR